MALSGAVSWLMLAREGRFGAVCRLGLILGDKQLACPFREPRLQRFCDSVANSSSTCFRSVISRALPTVPITCPAPSTKGAWTPQAPILAADPAGFLETTGPPRQGLGVARLALLAEGAPLRITRIRGALALGKDIRPAQRFVRVAGPQRLLAMA